MNIRVDANPVFKEVNRSTKRYIVENGSAGSGKSVDAAQHYILRLMNDKGRNLVALRKSDITNRDSTFLTLYFSGPPPYPRTDTLHCIYHRCSIHVTVT